MWQDIKVLQFPKVCLLQAERFMTWLQLMMFWIHETEKNLFPGAWEGFFRGAKEGGN